MKITIDFDLKTIKVEDQVNFVELNKKLKEMLGDKLKDYNVVPFEYKTNFLPYVQPSFVPYYPNPQLWPVFPQLPQYPIITYGAGNAQGNLGASGGGINSGWITAEGSPCN